MLKAKKVIDKATVIISSLMIAAMMIILVCNVILRYIPGIGGFKWYMESSQYLNVWAMLIIGIEISMQSTHLHVEIVDSIVAKRPGAKKVVKVITSVFIALFYVVAAYSGYLLASKAKQAVSTMPAFTMGQVYTMIPIACILCAAATIFNMIYELSGQDEKEKEGEVQ
ncbi:MAG: TRAP transporter small permease subunit [Lachnospiraceae bacterium]|nr:TRAP transporter small permease subunit [Lachnospiraceae bacterium]